MIRSRSRPWPPPPSRPFGRIDFLVANAGIQHYGTVLSTEPDQWDAVLRTNLTSVYLTIKYCAERMLQRGGGAIVTTASVQGLQSQYDVAPYATSKGGVIALSRASAIDLAEHGIRVNSISPGTVRTSLAGGTQDPDAAFATAAAHHVLKRVGEPEEVADLVLFLCSGARRLHHRGQLPDRRRPHHPPAHLTPTRRPDAPSRR